MTQDELPFPLLFAEPVNYPTSDFDLAAKLTRFRPMRPTGQRDQILIVTCRSDKHADEVMVELMTRGIPVRRVNVDGFPDTQKLAVDIDRGILTHSGGEIRLDEIRSVWMRRPIITLFHSGALADSAAACARLESEVGFHGLLSLLNDCYWVNSPLSLWAAESKVRQLRVANSLGMTIPRTLVTSNPERARAFYESCAGRVIVKVFRGQLGSPDTGFRMILTSRVKPEHLDHLERVRNSPCIFQEEVPKDVELRITVMGRSVFPVEISNQSDLLDWRDTSARSAYRPVTLPPDIEAACLQLVDRYGLVSAGIDMIRKPDGQHIFLELNAHHEWLWLQRITGLPMCSAMATLLDQGSSIL